MAKGESAMERAWLKHYPEGVRGHLDYPAVPLFRLLEESVARHPERTAVRFYSHTLTYRQLLGAVNKCANALLAMGVGEGDRVAVMMPNCPQYVIAYFGILKAGAIVAQANPLYVEREIEHLMNDCGARVLICADVVYPRVAAAMPNITGLKQVLVARLKGDVPLGEGAVSFEATIEGAPHTDPGVAVSHEAIAVLQYTGGTTGVSKGAMLTHQNLMANVMQMAAWAMPMAAQIGEGRMLTVLPLFHVYAMTVCMNYGLYAGMELILLPKFDLNEVLETIRQTQPTHFPGVPTMYVAVNSHPRAEEYGVSSIKLCNSGGAAMPVELMRAFEHRFGATICEGYGLSETSPITHANPVTGLRKPGSVGLAMPDTDCKIVDVETGTRELPPGESGELILRGPQVFAGYWQMPEETRNALRELNGETWFYTGDICRTDEDGYVYVTDRKKDMIIAGGFNIYPRDVEEALYLHPAVQEAVVAGMPDAYRGETVKAYVVLRAGQSLTAGQLEAHCREHLAAFKVPRFYEFRESLPKSAVGKVLRRVLQEEERRKLAMAD
ncbi:MAG: long-chain fatty acid--CoA ligase [Firmicutes bacterium]|nr:long-chain fatty acid--CoA ligase [Bacillota bacterium]